MLKRLRDRKIFFLDRDGTLTIGNRPIPGANDFIRALRDGGHVYYVLTNNSSKTPDQHHARFRELGLDVARENVLVSIQSALDFLHSEKVRRLFWVANEAVSSFIHSKGFEFDESQPEAILLTFDTELTYRKLENLTHLVRRGVPYYTTHRDIVCPTERGPIPDAGTIIKVIEMATGVTPLKSFGKPEKTFIDPILQRHGLNYSDAVMIGDRLYTDIKMAEGTQILSVLVLSGETTRQDHDRSPTKADVVVDSLKDLIPFV